MFFPGKSNFDIDHAATIPKKVLSAMASRLSQLVRHPSQTRQAFAGWPSC